MLPPGLSTNCHALENWLRIQLSAAQIFGFQTALFSGQEQLVYSTPMIDENIWAVHATRD